jgi:hypothetical protein
MELSTQTASLSAEARRLFEQLQEKQRTVGRALLFSIERAKAMPAVRELLDSGAFHQVDEWHYILAPNR